MSVSCVCVCVCCVCVLCECVVWECVWECVCVCIRAVQIKTGSSSHLSGGVARWDSTALCSVDTRSVSYEL